VGRTKEGGRIQKTVDRIRSDGQRTTDNGRLTTDILKEREYDSA
jgi:hypothetical protein